MHMPKVLGGRGRGEAEPADGSQTAAGSDGRSDAGSGGTGNQQDGARPEPDHNEDGVYDQDVAGASFPVNQDGAASYGDQTDHGRGGANPYDQDAPYQQGASPEPAPAPEEAAAPDSGGPPDAARLFPEPVVIGAAPSFPVSLGSLPTTPGNMSGSAVPDTALDGGDLPGLAVRGASLRGEDHRNTGVIRQDSMGMWRVNDGKMAAVLVCATDGVSSQPNSHRGAVAMCQLLRDLTQEHLSRFFKAGPATGVGLLWELMAEQLAKQLSDLALRQNMEPVTVSTTLAAALIEENPQDPAERRYVILNVGDATAYLLRGGEFTQCLVDPHEGEITESGTWTLPTSIGEVKTATGTLAPGGVLMVCSDGMSNPMRNGNVQQRLAQWWSADQVPGLLEFGWQVGYRAKTYGDDRTAVCVWSR